MHYVLSSRAHCTAVASLPAKAYHVPVPHLHLVSETTIPCLMYSACAGPAKAYITVANMRFADGVVLV